MMERNHILVVDNEPQLLDLVELHLTQFGLRTERGIPGLPH